MSFLKLQSTFDFWMPIKFISYLSYTTQKENFQLSEGMCGNLFFFYSFHNPKHCAENSGCLMVM